MSTRNTLPSAVRSPSSRMTSRPRRVKKSSLSMQRAPAVVPLSGNRKMRSMSEEKLSSPPPSLPMPSTMNAWRSPAVLSGSPYVRTRSWLAYSTAAWMAASANALVSASVSFSVAQPARSRHAMRTISRSRWRRSAAMNPARSGSAITAARRCAISPRASGRVSAASSMSHLARPASRARLLHDEVAGGEHARQCVTQIGRRRLENRERARFADACQLLLTVGGELRCHRRGLY